jgi:hypothetical protein
VSSRTPPHCPPQEPLPLSELTRIVVTNRQDCCQARITCYQLELLSSLRAPLYAYPFTTAAGSYSFRDSSDAGFAASCALASPQGPLPALATTPPCPSAANEHLRFVRIIWSGACSASQPRPLQLAELQVWYGGHNIALGQPISAKDVLGNSPEFSGSQLVDGKALTIYHSASAGAGSHVTADLQVGWACEAHRRRGQEVPVQQAKQEARVYVSLPVFQRQHLSAAAQVHDSLDSLDSLGSWGDGIVESDDLNYSAIVNCWAVGHCISAVRHGAKLDGCNNKQHAMRRPHPIQGPSPGQALNAA